MATTAGYAGSRKSSRWRLVIKGVAVVAAICLGILVIDIWTGRDRQSASDVEAEIAAALPSGSTDAEINAYLDRRRLHHGTIAASANDTDQIGHGVQPGTVIILAGIRQSASIFWYGAKDFYITFVLDDSRRLERFFVTEREYGPS